MTDHAWAQEHIAAAVAGGLSAEESGRLDAHVGDCPECAAALADARNLDHSLNELFAPVRPGPLLEDRMILALRKAHTKKLLLAGWRRKLAVGVAASVGLGLTGALAGHLADDGGLPFPGADRLIQVVDSSMSMSVRPDMQKTPTDGSPIPGPEALARGLAERTVQQWKESGADANWRVTEGARGTETFALDARSGGATDFGLADANKELGGGTAPPRSGPAYGQAQGRPTGLRGLQAGSGETYYRKSEFSDQAPASGIEYKTPAQLAVPVPTDDRDKDRALSFGFEAKPPAVPSAPEPAKPEAAFAPAVIPVPTPATGASQAPGTEGQQPPPAQNPRQIVIRSGDIEFEVDSFDSAAATVTQLVTKIKGSFVATVNSEKLPNGKVKGSIVVRVPPEALDSLVLDLRKEIGKAGELKGQKIGSQDITKQYTDLDSRLKAARTMEARLLQIIKDGKGEIKQLLDAEKELGVWRTRIEEMEGEKRYYDNLVGLSTLTITLAEKEIRAAAVIKESEVTNAGVEVEDVDQARRAAMAAVAEMKGRVTKSDLKQVSTGVFNVNLEFEVPPDSAGPMLDRLRQIGRVTRLQIDRVQTAEGGPVTKDAKLTKGDAQFKVQIYNPTAIEPREKAALTVAVEDVPAAYRALREAVAKVNGRVLTAQLNEQDRQNVTAQFDFEVRRADEAAVQAALTAAGDVIGRDVSRAAESQNVTDAKVLFKTTLQSVTKLKPRENTTLAVEVENVDLTVAAFGAQVAEVKGRQVDAQVTHERAGRVTAHLIYDVPLAAATGLTERFKSAGTVRVSQTSHDPQAPEGRFALARITVTLSNADLIVAPNDGVWPQVRNGLSISMKVLLMSVTWVVFGLCVVVPWAVVGYGGYRLFRRLFRPAMVAPPAAPAP